MHVAPMRRRSFPSSCTACRLLPIAALLLLAGGCAIRDPGPSPMVCPSTPGGCAKEDAPWYRQDVTAMIPPPPVDPAPPPDPAPSDDTAVADAASGDPLAPAWTDAPVTGPVVSSFAKADPALGMQDAQDAPPQAGTAPTAPPPMATAPAPGGNPSATQGPPAADARSATIVRLPSDGLFELGGATLGPTGRRALDALADRLHGTPYARIRVIGHTDRTGRATTNLKLSWQRARVVRDHLATRGIPAEVLDHEGRGSRDAAVDPDRCGRGKDARIRCLAPDRRVDIVVTPQPVP
jgi:outer membrane protein OmpA-like peptidoglycan-associated protein